MIKKKAPNLRNPALPNGLSITLYHKKEALALCTYCALQGLRYLYYIKLAQNSLRYYIMLCYNKYIKKLKVHGVYRHFKGNYYSVEDVAYHSETKKEME